MKIPISVVHLKGTRLDGKGPLYLYGYGSYGDSIDLDFDPDLFSMVDRGVVAAVAHIRGGGEMGKAWHDDGRMMHKKNTFTDFIACAEYLVAHGYGSKDRLVIEGESAGGLLMGAVLNLRPDLFKAALVGVPFVDVMNTMLDESLPLTVTEFWMVHTLVRFPGHVKNRDQLMREAELVVDDATITSHIKRIRKKFIAVAPEFDAIETVHGVGYRWKP